jgi:hypothetical protein
MGLGNNQSEKGKAADEACVEPIDSAIACGSHMEYGEGKRDCPYRPEHGNDLVPD